MIKAIKEASKKVSYTTQIKRAKKMVKKNDIVEQMASRDPKQAEQWLINNVKGYKAR